MRVRIEIEDDGYGYYYGSNEEIKTVRASRVFSDYLPRDVDPKLARSDLLESIADFARVIAGDYIRAGR